jgi:flagellin-like protein
MNLKQLLHDDDAVSPVIGVILMVAITVILAAVIGTFVLGLGQNVQKSSPTASISFDQSGDVSNSDAEVTISHDGGDPLNKDNIDIIVNGSNPDPGNAVKFWANNATEDKKITAGETITVADSDTGDKLGPGATVKVVWTADGGESSNVLAEYEVE